MDTYRPSAVAAHAPLCHHTFTSIDHQHLVLDRNLIFGLNGMFKVQNTIKSAKQKTIYANKSGLYSLKHFQTG